MDPSPYDLCKLAAHFEWLRNVQLELQLELQLQLLATCVVLSFGSARLGSNTAVAVAAFAPNCRRTRAHCRLQQWPESKCDAEPVWPKSQWPSGKSRPQLGAQLAVGSLTSHDMLVILRIAAAFCAFASSTASFEQSKRKWPTTRTQSGQSKATRNLAEIESNRLESARRVAILRPASNERNTLIACDRKLSACVGFTELCALVSRDFRSCKTCNGFDCRAIGNRSQSGHANATQKPSKGSATPGQGSAHKSLECDTHASERANVLATPSVSLRVFVYVALSVSVSIRVSLCPFSLQAWKLYYRCLSS